MTVQRLFSTFADGWPGAGLLLQRLLAGGGLLYHGAIALNHLESATPQLLGAAAGTMLLAGFWTPVAGVAVAIVEVWIVFFSPGNQCLPLMLAILGSSLAMIGPGAWSVDARLFGRKQINPDL